MARRRLVWKLYPIAVAVILLSIAAAGWYADGAVRGFYLSQIDKGLEARAALVRFHVAPSFAAGSERSEPEDLDALCRALAQEAGARVTVIAADGRVLGESDRDRRALDNHGDRPEVREALGGRAGAATRYSDTVNYDMRYVALPVMDGSRVVGVVRVATPLSELGRALGAVYRRVALGGLVVAVLASGLGLLVFIRLVGRPLEEIKRSAEEFAGGDLSHQIPVADSEEFGSLAESLNRMAAQIDEKVRTITRQGHEQRAVLASMIEGVLAIDASERIMSLNDAAAEMLQVEPARALGRSIPEVVRNTQLQRFVAKALSSAQPVEADIVLPRAAAAPDAGDGDERFLQASGTVLRDPAGRGIGALVVLNDVTRLRRLENIRRDFVANVSHELKTPVTSIKGFVETLRDGALDDREKAQEFLAIITRQADRLHAIIEDLLKLSRIEQDSERAQIELAPHRLREVLQSAVGDCQSLAKERGVAVTMTCPADLVARINAPLVEQAVVNLLDNAIKYTEPGTTVELEARADGGELTISVRDRGCGIPAEHLPRIFERFYRVDKARSRRQGGTGLGLAIVKHIAHAHRGAASVESTVGEGSTFTLRIPIGSEAGTARRATAQAT